MKNLILILFYLPIYFGIVNMLGKNTAYDEINKVYIIISILLFLGLYFTGSFRLMKILHLVLYAFFTISNFYFSNFIIDLLFPPTIPALNCSGALPMNGNWVRGLIISMCTTPLLIYMYWRNSRALQIFENCLILFAVIILLILIIFSNIVLEFNQYVIEIARPIVIYPDNC